QPGRHPGLRVRDRGRHPDDLGAREGLEIGAMVTRLLRLTEIPKPADAADALALAICHVWRGGAQHRLAEAVARATRQPPRR
ncbi:crossover junction endodeoxyribonuclease RuvC, partial [Nonomuraea fuscirosea]